MTNSIAEVEKANCILVIGSNTTENHPIIGQKIKAAVRNHGAKLIVADPRAIELTEYAHIWLRQKPGTDLALINGLLHVIVEEKLYDEEFIRTRTEGFDEVKKVVAKYTPEYVEEITGVPAEDIRRAARLYAQGPRSSIYYAMGITQHVTGTYNVMALANLAMACGHIGKEGTGVNPLRGQNNVQGACDMGGLPNVYPGYQRVDDDEVRKKFEEAWGVELPSKPGLTLVEMLKAAGEGKVRGLYIVGENPVLTDPDSKHVEEALQKLDFLVVQDIFLTETARYADVILPAAGFAEKEGTFTNTERRVQKLERALDPPGTARPDWQIIQDVARGMGYPMHYRTPQEIMEEIARLTPSYAGISYDRLGDIGLQWPCPDKNHPGTRFLHKDKFARGLGKFHAVEYQPAAVVPDEEYSIVLTTGRIHFHYHATISRRAKGLEEVCPEPYVEISPADAVRMEIRDGQKVKLISRFGEVEVKAKITPRVAPGVVFLSFHFAEAPVNRLVGPALDPVAKIPEYKAGAVKVVKA
ncbi:formate dehydrogenase alpha subunit [Calderihabitans maritimus]|uniref:Formate dehydrogenase alpha subunit n=3 Tax=Calderihabitans maritimus TaxID=1246530 RepID=A0A1Z5HXC5_9FIRM|nr:formate dehydrogenase alpha subunit [Calderihabitans maritimus]